MASSLATKVFFFPTLLWLWVTGDLTIFNAGAVLFLQLLVNYAVALWLYTRVHQVQQKQGSDDPPLIAPDYPSVIPFLGPLLSVLWDHGGFVRRLG